MKKNYEELIKDFATDEDLADFTKEIAQRCKQKHCAGLACFSAPQSEMSWTAIHSDFLTATFLLESLIQKVALTANISPTILATTIMWYFAQIETGAILEEEKIFDKRLVGRAEEFALQSLKDTIYRSKHAEWLDGTPIANQITTID